MPVIPCALSVKKGPGVKAPTEKVDNGVANVENKRESWRRAKHGRGVRLGRVLSVTWMNSYTRERIC